MENFVLPDKLVYLHFISSYDHMLWGACHQQWISAKAAGYWAVLKNKERKIVTVQSKFWAFSVVQLFLKNRPVQVFLCILKVKWPVIFFLLKTMRQVSESINSTAAQFKTFFLYSMTKLHSETVLRSSLPVNYLIFLAENHMNSVALP